MPWGKVVYNNYAWSGTSTDTKGKRYSLEAQVLANMILEVGQSDPDVGSKEDFWKLSLRWPTTGYTPTIITHTYTDYMFPEKNMASQMLHKVRRTNKIITEKTTNPGGVSHRERILIL